MLSQDLRYLHFCSLQSKVCFGLTPIILSKTSRCATETTTALLIGYTPIQNKRLVSKTSREWKNNVVHPRNGISFSYKEECSPDSSQMNLEILCYLKETRHKGHMWYDSMYLKCLEQAIQGNRKQAGSCHRLGERRMVRNCQSSGCGDSLWGEENALELDHSDSHITS